jgi:hypothetical protein
MVIRAQKKDIDGGYLSLFDIFKKRELKGDVDWRTEAEEIIAKLRDIKNSDEEGVKRLDSDSEKAVIDAIADNISKPSF